MAGDLDGAKPEADAREQAAEVLGSEAEAVSEVVDDATEADVLEQHQPAGHERVMEPPRVPDDATEADVLEQAIPAADDEDEEYLA